MAVVQLKKSGEGQCLLLYLACSQKEAPVSTIQIDIWEIRTDILKKPAKRVYFLSKRGQHVINLKSRINTDAGRGDRGVDRADRGRLSNKCVCVPVCLCPYSVHGIYVNRSFFQKKNEAKRKVNHSGKATDRNRGRGGTELFIRFYCCAEREREETNSLNTLVYKKNLLDYCRKDAKRETRNWKQLSKRNSRYILSMRIIFCFF